MKPIDRPHELKRYYQDKDVAQDYMRRRTGEPLNGILHRRQVGFLNAHLTARAPHTVLEIACGPGRLTAAVRGVPMGVAIDSSAEMLATAQQRMNGAAASWAFLRTDAFVLPFQSEAFDAVYTLRFVRHFQLLERQRLYREIRRVLRPRGVFIVDALNRDVSHPYRVKRGLERYHIYDVLYRPEEIAAELQDAGFRVVAVEGMIKHVRLQRLLNRLRRVNLGALATALIASLEHIPGSRPSGWMLLCEK
ncbi:MAG TPA: class I SAM-dependent methyltransferase [Candidatus Margulisiibacteriota bacterium]|nr:class I SAM-dependent methyltransferase [Candidatus Margulisiibacteriota bacterium]